jgi:hypothetical protein
MFIEDHVRKLFFLFFAGARWQDPYWNERRRRFGFCSPKLQTQPAGEKQKEMAGSGDTTIKGAS